MAVNISEVYVHTFENNVRHVAQQSQSKLRGTVQERGVQSAEHAWETIQAGTATKKTAPRTATPESDRVWGRRVSVPETWHDGDTSEQEDPVQMLIDPNSNIALSIGMSMRRAQDDSIIAAATGTALKGDGTTEAFPAGQVVGTGAEVISMDMVSAVQEIFMKNDIDPEVPKTAVVGPTQVRKLMQLTENVSADYVRAQQLQQYGIAPNWMGFNWINSTRLLAPDTGELSCLFYTNRALGMQMNRDITARVQEDPSISFAWRIYCFGTWGTVRVEDKQIVHGHFLDALS